LGGGAALMAVAACFNLLRGPAFTPAADTAKCLASGVNE
jgi:hypothetical protein